MASRTVRLDDDIGRCLEELVKDEGLSISGVVRQGILALRNQVSAPPSDTLYDIFRELSLGSGGYASAPSTDTRQGARNAIRRKLHR